MKDNEVIENGIRDSYRGVSCIVLEREVPAELLVGVADFYVFLIKEQKCWGVTQVLGSKYTLEKSVGKNRKYEVSTHETGSKGKYKRQNYLPWYADPQFCDGLVLQVKGKGEVICFLDEPYLA